MTARDLPNTELDGQLFLVRHLLVLKELAGGLNLVERGSNGPLELHHVAGMFSLAGWWERLFTFNYSDTLRDMLRTTNILPYAFAGAPDKLRDDPTAVGMKEVRNEKYAGHTIIYRYTYTAN